MSFIKIKLKMLPPIILALSISTTNADPVEKKINISAVIRNESIHFHYMSIDQISSGPRSSRWETGEDKGMGEEIVRRFNLPNLRDPLSIAIARFYAAQNQYNLLYSDCNISDVNGSTCKYIDLSRFEFYMRPYLPDKYPPTLELAATLEILGPDKKSIAKFDCDSSTPIARSNPSEHDLLKDNASGLKNVLAGLTGSCLKLFEEKLKVFQVSA